MKMKMGSGAVGMAMVLISVSLLQQLADARGQPGTIPDDPQDAPTTTCLTAYGAASFADATDAVNFLLTKTTQMCCPVPCPPNQVCCTQRQVDQALVKVCSPASYCPTCLDVGIGLRNVLALCNVDNTIEGVYNPLGSAYPAFYLTSAANHPPGPPLTSLTIG